MTSTPGSRPSLGAILAGLLALVAAVLAGAWVVLNWPQVAASFFPPEAATAQGVHIRDLYNVVFAIAVVIFFVVEGLIVWSVIRYRRRAGDDELPPQTHGHNVAEVVWTVIPTLIVAFMFVVSWQTLNSVEAVTPSPDLRVHVVGQQFNWRFQYLDETGQNVVFEQLLPQGAEGGLSLPAGETTHLTLESTDVIHAFYVPQFLFKRDVVPGHVNSFDLTTKASDAGRTFRGQCAELCGTQHAIMLFDVHVLAPADFDTWLQAAIEKANASPSPPPSGEPPPSGAPPAAVNITAKDTNFLEKTATAPADTPFTIHFDNQDAGTPHDVDIRDGGGTTVADNEFFPGVAVRDYPIAPLTAGDYTFFCSIHSNMTGTLTVQ